MTKKLKTLKDIDSFVGYPDGEKTGIYSIGVLQDTAREWYDMISDRAFPDCEKDWSEEPIEEWIKYFFNLEDD